METKICSKCKEGKPLSEFYTNKNYSTGYATYCKKCSRIAAKEWREKNKERAKEISQNWNKANKEKALEQNKKRVRKWRSNNREKANAAVREYKKKNPEKTKAEARRGRVNCCHSYIKTALKNQGFIDSQITPDVIEEKRNIIKTTRIIRKINQSINKKTKTL